jgi:hypothetical protein
VANPWSRKAKRKPSLKGLAKTNGEAPVKPSLASLTKGKSTEVTTKPSLRKLVSSEPIAVERPYQEPKERVKEDFRVGGVLFSGAEITDKVSVGHRDGTFRSVGTVDVTNGDQTYTLHNRYGSWMHDVWGTANMAEPARVAAWLGINMSQLDMCQLLTKRFEAELKKQGIPNKQQQRAKIEADAAKARKRTKQPEKETPVVTPKKPSLRGLKGKK